MITTHADLQQFHHISNFWALLQNDISMSTKQQKSNVSTGESAYEIRI